MPHLELQNIRKAFSETVVPVKDLSLKVNEGDFLTLLGPSGCGKSTTLRIIAGLEAPTQGEIRIGKRSVTALKPGDRNIAMVFQSYALYPHMTVFDNIASPLKLQKQADKTIRDRVTQVAASLNLEDLLKRKPGQLSGGQRQRVALGRALVRNPDVFLLDEPLSNLDALLREQVRAELKQLFNQRQAPVVYVTHDQTEAMSLSSQVAVLNEGHLQQLASPQTIYQKPANTFVASFIGSPQMNLMTLPYQSPSVKFGESQLTPPHVGEALNAITLGIRPEHLYLTASDGIRVQATVTLVEHLGMNQLVTAEMIESGQEVRALVTAPCPSVGDTIHLGCDVEHLHWFHPETGLRLAS